MQQKVLNDQEMQLKERQMRETARLSQYKENNPFPSTSNSSITSSNGEPHTKRPCNRPVSASESQHLSDDIDNLQGCTKGTSLI